MRPRAGGLVNHERCAPATIGTLLDGKPVPARLRIGGLVKVALSDVGIVDPASRNDHRAQGGMAALRKALDEMTPEQVIAEVKASKLLGRGGAAFFGRAEVAVRRQQPAAALDSSGTRTRANRACSKTGC